MRLAVPADVPHLVDLLNCAFRQDPHIEWFIGCPRDSAMANSRRRALMRYLGVASISIGEAWLTDSGQAAAFWLRHDAKPRGARYMLANLGYLFGCGLTATLRSLKAEKDLTRRLPHSPYRFLWTIGVEEAARGTGQVRELLKPHLDKADQAGIPVFLETVVERNIAIYHHYGFEVECVYQVDTGLPVVFMRRSPISDTPCILCFVKQISPEKSSKYPR